MNPIRYRHVAARLEHVEQLARLAHVSAELYGGPPAYDIATAAGIVGLMRSIIGALGKRFPVDEDPMELYELEDRPETVLAYLSISRLVHFMGLDLDRWWDDWEDPFKLVLALTSAGPPSDFWPYGAPYCEAPEWWQGFVDELDLPPLGEISANEAIGRLERLPKPWNGLWAIFCWFVGDTGYLFVDVPPAYAHEMEFGDLVWDMATIEMLTEDYKLARREIFQPAWDLCEFCRKDRSALRVCFQLALGGDVDAAIHDGDLVKAGSN